MSEQFFYPEFKLLPKRGVISAQEAVLVRSTSQTDRRLEEGKRGTKID
jgi:hypothetical protein